MNDQSEKTDGGRRWIFEALKKGIRGRRIASDVVQAWIQSCFRRQMQTSFCEGIDRLLSQWHEFINSYGDYFGNN